MGELDSPNHRAIRDWSGIGGSLLLGAPLLLLILLAIIALCLSTSPVETWHQANDPVVIDAVVLSIKTTLAALAAIVVFGSGIALAIARLRNWLGHAIEIVVTLPAIMPPSVAGIALLLAFGRQGMIGSHFDAWGIKIAFTPIAVVMAQVFVAAPFFVRELASGLGSIDRSMLEAARLDGAGGSALASRIMLPICMPFLVSGAVLAWARAVGEFGATILFAGNLPGVTQTMPLAIYLGFETNLEQAKALAAILMVSAIAVLAVVRFALRRQMTFAH